MSETDGPTPGRPDAATPPAANAGESGNVYRLTCKRCPYDREVAGLGSALDAAETHEDRTGGGHSVDAVMLGAGAAPYRVRSPLDGASVSDYPPRL